MHSIRALIAVLSTALLITGCKKYDVKTTPLSSLTITNAVIGGMQVKLSNHNAAIQYINPNAASSFSLPAGSNRIYVWPVLDSLKPYYNQSLTTAFNDIYSLFLTGTPDAVESILVKEDLPVLQDSSFGVRFVNLAPGSPAVKVTLSTSATVSEFGNVEYKGITTFKTYPALSTPASYIFQVRNAATDALIASITLTGTSAAAGIPRLSNITLVLRGKVGGTPAAGITRVNHYFKL